MSKSEKNALIVCALSIIAMVALVVHGGMGTALSGAAISLSFVSYLVFIIERTKRRHGSPKATEFCIESEYKVINSGMRIVVTTTLTKGMSDFVVAYAEKEIPYDWAKAKKEAEEQRDHCIKRWEEYKQAFIQTESKRDSDGSDFISQHKD